nr:M73 family metallopeptidase [Bacilli bacterium]
MKSSRKRRVIALALAGVAFLGATSVTIMGTMALFSDTKKANNHINAGSLNLGFELTNLKGKMPNASTGILEDVDDSTVVDLTADGAKIFDIDNAVPGLDLTATLRLTNNGSVAFSSVTSIVDLEL